jgi:hypothetical protein
VPDTILPATSVLPGHEVQRRVALLAELQRALEAEGIQAVLVTNRRLVLRSVGIGAHWR